MTRQSVRIGTRLHDAAFRTRKLKGELQHRSWFGGPPATTEIANLQRAAVYLDEAAEELAGEALAPRSLMITLGLLTVLSASVTAALLVAAPDPARPEVVVGALMTAWAVDEIIRRIVRAVQFRRLIVKAAATPPTPVEERIGKLYADVDALLPSLEDREDVADSVRAALSWLD